MESHCSIGRDVNAQKTEGRAQRSVTTAVEALMLIRKKQAERREQYGIKKNYNYLNYLLKRQKKVFVVIVLKMAGMILIPKMLYSFFFKVTIIVFFLALILFS